MIHHTVCSPVAIMRAEPTESAVVVSQALFSEAVESLEARADWVKIRTCIDEYQGWVHKTALCTRETPYATNPADRVIVDRLASHLYAIADTVYGPLITLPFESRLEVRHPQDHPRWIQVVLPDGRQAHVQRGDVCAKSYLLKPEEIGQFTTRFLGLPYTWGGRSSFGYDCSGFVQMLYRLMGVSLPRDSQDQARWKGFTPVTAPLHPADLIFFGHHADAIQHVGVSLGGEPFVHATVAENAPYIRVSRLSDPEWSSSGRWSYSHCLRLIQ